MIEDRLPLGELLAKAGDGDSLRTTADSVMQFLIEADVEGLIGAGRYDRALERATYRNAIATAGSTRGSARCSFAFPSFGGAANSRRFWSRECLGGSLLADSLERHLDAAIV